MFETSLFRDLGALQDFCPLQILNSNKGDFTSAAIVNMGGTTNGKYVNAVSFNNKLTSSITVTATFKATDVAAAIRGSTFSIETTDGGRGWLCGSLTTLTAVGTPVASKLTPGACK